MRCLINELFLASYPPSPPLTLYVVCCVVHQFLQNCVYSKGGGGICVCMRQVCWLLCVCVSCTPQPTVIFFFMFYPFDHSRLERSVF